MRPYNTQYFKEYHGENAHTELHQDFYDIMREIDYLGIPLRKPKTQPEFERDKNGKDRTAEELVLLAFETPLAEVYLKGVKWADKLEGLPVASLTMNIRHFRGLEARFQRFEELKEQFNLQYRGTHQFSEG